MVRGVTFLVTSFFTKLRHNLQGKILLLATIAGTAKMHPGNANLSCNFHSKISKFVARQATRNNA